jgi:hypothetical protein
MKPEYMKEKNSNVYLNIPEYGILVFNQYGGYQQTIPLVNVPDFQIIEKNIVYYNDYHLIEFNPQVQVSRKISISDTSEVIDAKMATNSIYVFTKNKVRILKKK